MYQWHHFACLAEHDPCSAPQFRVLSEDSLLFELRHFRHLWGELVDGASVVEEELEAVVSSFQPSFSIPIATVYEHNLPSSAVLCSSYGIFNHVYSDSSMFIIILHSFLLTRSIPLRPFSTNKTAYPHDSVLLFLFLFLVLVLLFIQQECYQYFFTFLSRKSILGPHSQTYLRNKPNVLPIQRSSCSRFRFR